MVYRFLKQIEQLLLPPTCVLCGQSCAGPAESTLQSPYEKLHANTFIDLCSGCIDELPCNSSACVQCAEQLPAMGRKTNLCGACLRRPPRFHQAFCAFRYHYPVDHLIRALKYHGRLVYSRLLGTLLARSLTAARVDPWPTLIVPVPLAAARIRERGFNQATELSIELAKHLQVPMDANLLTRQRATSEQAGLKRHDRRKNVRGAFVIRGELLATHVAIVDDVITTGSTVNEIAKILRRAGAKRIEVWAVARASR